MKGKTRRGIFFTTLGLGLLGAGLLGPFHVPGNSAIGAVVLHRQQVGPGTSTGSLDASLPGATENVPAPCDKSVETFLLLGLDARSGGPSRSDAIVVVAVNQQTGSVRTLSIPRDLLVDRPASPAPSPSVRATPQAGKINTAYFWGESLHYPGGGLALAKRTVADAVGIDIDHAAAVDMEGFAKLVDVVGGVEVYLESALVDERYADFYSGHRLGLTIPEGWQHLDGATARGYVRSRYADDDFARMRRQQELLRALVNKLLTPGVFLKLAGILDSVRETIVSDLSISEMPGFFKLARGVDWANSEKIVIGRNDLIEHGDGITEYWIEIPADRLEYYGMWLTRGCNG